MTAYNLSVCIAPSVLYPPDSGSLELEDNLIKKICLVQFLIENCLRIFGEDITSLLGENSMSRGNSEKAAVVSGNQPLESKPVRVRVIYKKAQLQNDTKTPSDMVPPNYLSTVF
ncbi:rho GTPase-activating protein 20-like [Mirounga angustirostris]|uniref:rho GTPase-activating protein 20-like n=1 Tax=Mirounga angustirostris TaxID=9716 RepID=UPI00313E7B2C